MKREHYRPFDPIAAQAGAPYGHKDNAIEVKIYEYFENYCTAAYMERANFWLGTSYDYKHDYLVMLPEATCQGKPVYRGDTLYDSDGDKFQFEGCHTQSLLDTCTWEPAKKWPETTLSDEGFYKIHEAFRASPPMMLAKGYREVANAALAHACETGQVVPKGDLFKLVQGVFVCYGVAGEGITTFTVDGKKFVPE